MVRRPYQTLKVFLESQVWVEDCHLPLCDSRYGNLLFIRDSARSEVRLAGLGLSRLGEGRRTGISHAYRCPKTCPHVFLYVLGPGWSRGSKLADLEPDAIHTWPDMAYDGQIRRSPQTVSGHCEST